MKMSEDDSQSKSECKKKLSEEELKKKSPVPEKEDSKSKPDEPREGGTKKEPHEPGHPGSNPQSCGPKEGEPKKESQEPGHPESKPKSGRQKEGEPKKEPKEPGHPGSNPKSSGPKEGGLKKEQPRSDHPQEKVKDRKEDEKEVSKEDGTKDESKSKIVIPTADEIRAIYSGELKQGPEKEPLEAMPVKYLKDLLKTLNRDLPDAFYVEGLLKNVILWRKNKDIPEDHVLYGPFADYKYGACVSIFNTSYQAVSFYSQDPEDERLLEALLTTGLVDWKSQHINCVLDGIPDKLMPIVNQIVAEKKLEKHFSMKTELYWMDKERARNLKIEFPPEMKLERLTTKQVDFLDKYWPHQFAGSKEYLQCLLERNLSLGLFEPFSENPVAWVVCSHASTIAMLFTLETHRRKGYARMLVTAMARKLGEMDIDPRATILDDNEASKILFMMLGYRTGEGSYFHYIGLNGTVFCDPIEVANDGVYPGV